MQMYIAKGITNLYVKINIKVYFPGRNKFPIYSSNQEIFA